MYRLLLWRAKGTQCHMKRGNLGLAEWGNLELSPIWNRQQNANLRSTALVTYNSDPLHCAGIICGGEMEKYLLGTSMETDWNEQLTYSYHFYLICFKLWFFSFLNSRNQKDCFWGGVHEENPPSIRGGRCSPSPQESQDWSMRIKPNFSASTKSFPPMLPTHNSLMHYFNLFR